MSQPFPAFEVIPAVDVQGGAVVQLVQGERGTGTEYGDPVAAAERWVAAGARTLHFVDLDGAFEGQPATAAALEAIVAAAHGPVQLGSWTRPAPAARRGPPPPSPPRRPAWGGAGPAGGGGGRPPAPRS